MMRALQYQAKGAACLADIPVPSLQPGHALLRVHAAGLCHTDIDVLHGRYGEGRFPLVPGHEYAGIVEAVADDVTGLAVGARVVVDPNMACGHCRACQNGKTNLCNNLKAYGVTQDGGFAEYSLVKVDHLHDIGTLPFDQAALAEPLACVLNGIGNANLRIGHGGHHNALVFGAGPIGLLLALALKAKGIADVTVADISDSRLSFAQSLGLSAMASGSAVLTAQRHAFDFVADATGIARVVEEMIAYTADGGTALVFGVSAPDQTIAVRPFEIFRRQISLVGSHSLNRQIPQALDLLHKDDGAMAKLVSHRLPLSEIIPFITKSSPVGPSMKVQFSVA
jgi:D-altritol 5-dehydrogenase